MICFDRILDLTTVETSQLQIAFAFCFDPIDCSHYVIVTSYFVS